MNVAKMNVAKMNVAIVENEQHYLDKMLSVLTEWQVENTHLSLSTYSYGEDIIRDYKNNKVFDVIFMDISLDGKSGLVIAQDLRDLGYENHIIFTTNHNEFMRDGYDVNAFQYLIKPVSYSDVAKCFEKMEAKKWFYFSYNKEKFKLNFDDILYFEIKNHNVLIFTTKQDTPFVFKGQLKVDILPFIPKRFVQCHRSYVINIKHVSIIKNKLIHFGNFKVIKLGNAFEDSVLERFMTYF